ncbi:hypothetical protein [Abiotrophia defectiva]|nr:hypothetical protein [Abiotrophia defectiva]QKH47352.1 hypothetical protein FOC79_07035 [Abiotrophia defectiva]
MIITEMSGLVTKKRMAGAKKNGLVRVWGQDKWEGASLLASKNFATALAMVKSNWLERALYQGKMSPINF